LKLEETEFVLDFAEKVQDNWKVFGYFINAFFAAPASIRDGGGVMHYEYQGNPKFKNWFDSAGKNLHANFPYQFWLIKRCMR
jgi:hypothetical protein